MKKYFSVTACEVDDFDAMPDVYIVLAESKEAAKEEVKKLYDNDEIEFEVETHKEIDMSLPLQKVFPCWWDHLETE